MLKSQPKKTSRKKSYNRIPLTDREVELVRQLHEVEGWGYKRIAKKFDKPKSTIQYICRYITR